jgi:hypothetical protein
MRVARHGTRILVPILKAVAKRGFRVVIDAKPEWVACIVEEIGADCCEWLWSGEPEKAAKSRVEELPLRVRQVKPLAIITGVHSESSCASPRRRSLTVLV